jgi:hypothetical protein
VKVLCPKEVRHGRLYIQIADVEPNSNDKSDYLVN